MGQDYTDAPMTPDEKKSAYTDSPVASDDKKPSDVGGISMALAAHVVPFVQRVFEEAATNPAIKKTMATVGQVAGGIEGAMSGGPLAAAGGVWAGGKAGWHSGALIQRLAAPVATVADKVAPYAQGLSTLSGAQGVGDLAQMADPSRQDIGTLGIGKTVNVPGMHPAVINALADKIRSAIHDALATVSHDAK